MLLTLALMLGMMIFRGQALLSGETRIESIAMREPNWPRQATLFANCFGNQFELPVLFYVLTILSMMTRHADLLFVLLAWVFVALRVLQALVHVTIERRAVSRRLLRRRRDRAAGDVADLHRQDHAGPAMMRDPS